SAGDPVLEKFQGFAEAITVGERLADVEIDAPGPHPALGALFRCRSDHRRCRIFLFQVFADRGDLRQIAAVIEFECRHLAVRIALQVLRLPIFAAAQIDSLLGHFDAFFRHEHADNARVRPDRIIEFHCRLSPCFFVSIVVAAFEQTAGSFVKRDESAQASSSLLRSRTDCMIGSKFDRASSASNSWAVSDNSACERWMAIRTSSCGASDNRPCPDNRILEFKPFSRSSDWIESLMLEEPHTQTSTPPGIRFLAANSNA